MCCLILFSYEFKSAEKHTDVQSPYVGYMLFCKVNKEFRTVIIFQDTMNNKIHFYRRLWNSKSVF